MSAENAEAGRTDGDAVEASKQRSDRRLVERCAAGDERAWRELVLSYRALVYSVPVRMGLNGADADDVFQATFARLVEHVDKLRSPESVGAWLLTTARRLSRNAIQQRMPVADDESILEAVSVEAKSPVESLERSEQRLRVREALGALDERSSALLIQLYYESADRPNYWRISRRTGMPIGSIGPTRARSLRKLQAQYELLAASA